MRDHPDSDAGLRYRWAILAISTAILGVTMGQLINGLSVYFVPLETARGWSRGEIALINTSGLIGLALGSIVMGFATERYGVRPVVLMGITATGLAVAVASRATEIWQFYLLYFLAGALGCGAVSAPLMALVGNWFAVGAGLAIGIAAAGQALGQGGVPFSGAFLIEALGWRNAMLTQGLFTLVALLPLATYLREPPISRESAALADETPSGLPNAVITAWMSCAVICCCTCMSVPLIHLVPLIQDRGISAPNAGSVLFVLLLVAIAGRVAFGKLADVVGAIPAYFTASAWQTLLVGGFIYFDTLDAFYLYALIYGFGYGGVMTTLLVTTRNLVAPMRRASSLGIVLAFAYVGHGLGGWQGGLLFDVTGSYTWSYANAALAGVINLFIVGSLWLTVNRRMTSAPT